VNGVDLGDLGELVGEEDDVPGVVLARRRRIRTPD
jgi:hypothetical protein